MRFGVFFTLDYHPLSHPPKPEYLREALELAAYCDRLGLEVWVAEHHFSDYGAMPATAAFLAACAERTRTVRLGSAVAVLSLRHPLQVAEDYALVDVLSRGRLEFGVGSGYLEHEL
ncbi:MAG: LLM class flavin-dependent oxidoreductase, partial [Clostridia bacterium]|nr:LLM class flavin-dependent oxidoreductase [Clostridia bacterium]